MKRTLLVVLALLAMAGTLRAETTVRAEVHAGKLGVDDELQLTLTIEGEANLAQEVAVPALRNLRVAGGPFLSTQVSIVNGAMSQQRVYTWVLQPAAVGKAEIGSFTVKLAGGDKTTEPIAVDVVAGSIFPTPQRRRADPFDPFGGEDPFERLLGGRRERRPAPKVLVKVVPARTRLHVGEPLLLTYFVYTQTTIADLRFADAPQYPGFWSEDLEQPKDGRDEVVMLDGERFHRLPILRKLLFPTRAGQLTIPSAKFRIGLPRDSFFDVGNLGLTRASDPVTIAVDAIPEEPGFSGAVGRFSTKATLDKPSVVLGEAATLRFRIEGSGNLKWIDKGPTVNVPGARVYPPSTSSDLKTSAQGISGSKTWEFVVVPETTGTLDIPSLSFAYFDPEAGRIVRAETPALPLVVQGSGAGPGPVVPATGAAPLARGTLPLRAALDLPSAWLPQPSAKVLGAALLAALLLHAGLLLGPGLVERIRTAGGRPAPLRPARAALAAIERVQRDRMGKEAAAAALEKALHDVFGPLQNGGASGDGERERAARQVLGEVQFLRYAPQLGDYSDKIREVAARTADVIRRWA